MPKIWSLIPNRTKSLEHFYGLAYSSLNSAKLTCSNEVILCFINATVMPTAKNFLGPVCWYSTQPKPYTYVLPTKPVNNKVFGGFASHQIMRKFILRAVDLQLLLANIWLLLGCQEGFFNTADMLQCNMETLKWLVSQKKTWGAVIFVSVVHYFCLFNESLLNNL